jgi:DNA processing protein
MESSAASEQELAAWLRLSLTPGIGGESQRKLLAAFGLPGDIFAAGRLAASKVIGDRARHLFESSERDIDADIAAALAWAKVDGQHILTLADAGYPPALLQIADPPPLLYARGNLALIKQPALAIVGSRNATPQGIKITEDFAMTLACAGWVIVSGLALGIDAAAHRGALSRKAAVTTLAVIGTGADRIYPAKNQDLAREIAQRGLILSEFPLGTPALATNFPRRNRIIAGLARGVLVVEAAPQSGSLITARLASEAGREVFAIPGSIHSPLSKGCHHLIRQGAKLVEQASDILEELGAWEAAAAQGVDTGTVELSQPGDDTPEGHLWAALGHAPCALDELAIQTGMATDVLLSALLALEMEGRVKPLPGNRYQRLS